MLVEQITARFFNVGKPQRESESRWLVFMGCLRPVEPLNLREPFRERHDRTRVTEYSCVHGRNLRAARMFCQTCACDPREGQVVQQRRRLGRRADLVVGHHPHIPQRVELGAGKPVFFSLGNGLLGTPGCFHSGRPPYGMLAIVELDDAARLAAIELRLLEVDNAHVAFSPAPAESAAARRFLRSLVAPDQVWKDDVSGLRTELKPSAPARSRAA